MANKNSSLWIVLVLVGAGVIVLLLSFKQHSADKVAMQEVLNQKPTLIVSTPVTEKDPVPSPAIVTSPEAGKEAGFAVQVYSFKDQQRADIAVNNLKKDGYKAYIEISDLGEKGTWYRVRIGGLANEVEAKALLETIRKSFNSGIIVKPRI
jgi:cell division septation protein DedD